MSTPPDPVREPGVSLPGVFCRGMAMGAADIVPGVSGGTIAFITGIYFRLLEAISAVPRALVTELLRGRPGTFWHRVDGSFLLTLLAGILISVVSLATLITQAMEAYPIALWSFFFGLIIASIWHVSRQLKVPRSWLLVPLAAGTAFAWWVTTLTGQQVEPSALVFFGAGALAICAMILPGISGSFILVVLGMYAPVLAAIRSLDLITLALFAVGCVTGLLSIARLLTLAIRRFHDSVLALLVGFMAGALNRVWPWQQPVSWRTDSSGNEVVTGQVSVSPMRYAEVTGEPSQWPLAIAALVVGVLVVLLAEWVATANSSRKEDSRVT